MATRKLVRSSSDRMIVGVCGGVADYLDVDPTLVRLVFVILALTGMHGLLLYLILWIIAPLDVQVRPVPPAEVA